MEKVLVTGGAGFVGSVLVPMLLENGFKVTILDNFMYKNFQALLSQVQGHIVLEHPNFIKVIRGDIRDVDVVKDALKDQDIIIHLAALVGAPICKKHPEDAVSINVNGTLNLLKHTNKNQLFLFASTGSNYGAITEICTEETKLNPVSIYGQTKTKAEKAVLEKGGIAFRFATAFGIAPRLRLDLLINDFAVQLSKSKHLDVYESGARRTFIHVSDMARAFLFGIKHRDKMKGQVYNVGDELLNLTKKEVIESIRKKMVGKVTVLYDETKGSDLDQRDYEVSYKKIQSIEEGFHTTVTIEQGIKEIMDLIPFLDLENPYSNF